MKNYRSFVAIHKLIERIEDVDIALHVLRNERRRQFANRAALMYPAIEVLTERKRELTKKLKKLRGES